MMMPSSQYILIFLLLLCHHRLPVVVDAASSSEDSSSLYKGHNLHTIILSARQHHKCFQFLPPDLNQEITIAYDSPDIMELSEVQKEKRNLQQHEGYIPKDAISGREKHTYYHQSSKTTMDDYLNQDLSITIKQNSMEEEYDGEKKKKKKKKKTHHTKMGTVFLKQELKEKSGTMTFLSSPTENGRIQICFQRDHNKKKKKNKNRNNNNKSNDNKYDDSQPVRISISIVDMKEYDPNKKKNENKYGDSKVMTGIEHSVTRMETDLESLSFKLKRLQNTMIINQKEEVSFHILSTNLYGYLKFVRPTFHILLMILSTMYQIYQLRKTITRNFI